MPPTTPIASRVIATPIFDRTDGKTRSYASEEIEDLAGAVGFTDSLRCVLLSSRASRRPSPSLRARIFSPVFFRMAWCSRIPERD